MTFPQPPQTLVVSLSVNDAQYVYEHSLYQGITSSEYIRERIQNGLSAGIYESMSLR